MASTASQVGGPIGLAVLATAASAAGHDTVFLIAAGLGLAIAVLSRLLPDARATARREATRPGVRAPN